MFRRILLGAAVLAAIAVLYFFDVRLKSDDLPFYRKLVQESVDLHAHSVLEKSPVKQMRKGVGKDIWTIQNGARVHGRVICLQSDMTLTQKKEKMEAVEILHGIEAWIDTENQNRHLTAESGICYFPSCRMEARHLIAGFEGGKCIAKEAHLTQDTMQLSGAFQIEHPAGRIFGEKGTLAQQGASSTLQLEEGVLFEAAHAPFSISSMRAIASWPQNSSLLKLESDEIRFLDGVEIQTVSNIRAAGDSAILRQNSLRLLPKTSEPGSICSIFHGEDRIDAEEMQFDKASNELVCLAPHGRLEDTRTRFDADTGRAQFLEKGFQPQALLLEGNVRIASYLQAKESFAMADAAALYPNQKKIVLQSAPSSRVLFRQEGFEISAPTVHIQEAIQGFGDVRFFFYPEENTVLDDIFLKYL
jgi:hypothetical protein